MNYRMTATEYTLRWYATATTSKNFEYIYIEDLWR